MKYFKRDNAELERICEIIKNKAKEQLSRILSFQKNNRSFIELELDVCKNLNEIGAIILEESIPLIYGDGYKGSSVAVDEETHYSCVARKRERGLTTAFGKIKVNRAVYTEFHSGGIKSFFDEELDIEDRRKSPLVRYWSNLLGTIAPFDEAQDTLNKIRGINISTKQVEISTEQIGAEITKSHDENIQNIQLNKNGEISESNVNLNLNAEKTVYIETDGCHINTKNGWKECKTFMLFEIEKLDEKSQKLKNKFYYSTMKEVSELKRQVKFHLERYCGYNEVRIVCIGDGAKWIWKTMDELFPKDRLHSGIIEIVDWYHSIEKIADIKNEVFTNKEKGDMFYEQCKEYLKKGNIEVIGQILVDLRDKQKLTERKEFVDEKLKYFMNNKDKMRYEKFKEQGLCIGSGAIESANKYVVQRRLKLSGMKWNEDNANYMAHLRAEYINGKLEKHYNLRFNALIDNIAVT
jgi:hypothetical protein